MRRRATYVPADRDPYIRELVVALLVIVAGYLAVGLAVWFYMGGAR